MALQNAPVVTAQMLIRKPVSEVFAAFVDPAIFHEKVESVKGRRGDRCTNAGGF